MEKLRIKIEGIWIKERYSSYRVRKRGSERKRGKLYLIQFITCQTIKTLLANIACQTNLHIWVGLVTRLLTKSKWARASI